MKSNLQNKIFVSIFQRKLVGNLRITLFSHVDELMHAMKFLQDVNIAVELGTKGYE